MSNNLDLRIPMEIAYSRASRFAVEVLDGVSLSRLADGLTVIAEGLKRKPIVNASGLFVWVEEDPANVTSVSIDPGILPFQKVVRPKASLQVPLTTIEMSPNNAYPFAAGTTGLRGTLIESRLEVPPSPVADAEVNLQWLDEDGVTWREGRPSCRTTARGDFAAVLRLARSEVPTVNAGTISVRLHVQRDTGEERGSTAVGLPQGTLADPSTYSPGPGALTFAWDELQP